MKVFTRKRTLDEAKAMKGKRAFCSRGQSRDYELESRMAALKEREFDIATAETSRVKKDRLQ